MMSKLGSWAKKVLPVKTRFLVVRLLLPQISRAFVDPLTNSQIKMQKIHEVELAADLGCSKCRERVALAISRLEEMESVVVHLVEKKVTITARS